MNGASRLLAGIRGQQVRANSGPGSSGVLAVHHIAHHAVHNLKGKQVGLVVLSLDVAGVILDDVEHGLIVEGHGAGLAVQPAGEGAGAVSAVPDSRAAVVVEQAVGDGAGGASSQVDVVHAAVAVEVNPVDLSAVGNGHVAGQALQAVVAGDDLAIVAALNHDLGAVAHSDDLAVVHSQQTQGLGQLGHPIASPIVVEPLVDAGVLVIVVGGVLTGNLNGGHAVLSVDELEHIAADDAVVAVVACGGPRISVPILLQFVDGGHRGHIQVGLLLGVVDGPGSHSLSLHDVIASGLIIVLRDQFDVVASGGGIATRGIAVDIKHLLTASSITHIVTASRSSSTTHQEAVDGDGLGAAVRHQHGGNRLGGAVGVVVALVKGGVDAGDNAILGGGGSLVNADQVALGADQCDRLPHSPAGRAGPVPPVPGPVHRDRPGQSGAAGGPYQRIF